MVNQGDITLLQRITQSEAQSQSHCGSAAGPACGDDGETRGALRPLGHCAGAGPLCFFRAKNKAFESESFDIFVSNDSTGSG